MRYFNRDSLDFQFIEKFVAGIVLTGSDVKSLRTQGVQFTGAHVDIVANRPVLINLTIQPYKYSQNQTLDTTRERGLLLSEKEIAKLLSYRHQKYMLVPIAIFFKGKWLKLEIGVGRKMKKFEKRQKIREKEYKQGLG